MGKTHQAGWVPLRGKMWYGYFRRRVLDPTTEQNRVDIVCIQLGTKSKLTKSGARDALRMEVAKQTGQNVRGRVLKGQFQRPSNGSFVTAIFRFDRGTGDLRRRKKRCRR